MSFYKKNLSYIAIMAFVAVIVLSTLSVFGFHTKAKGEEAQANQVYIDYNYLISFVNLYSGNTKAAIADYEKVLPYLKNPYSYNEYANILLYAREYDRAENFLQKAIKAFPGNKMLYEKLLDIYIIKREDSKAINLIKNNKKIFKNSFNAYKKLAILYMRDGDYLKAISFFKKIRGYEKNTKILYYIAECYSANGNPNKALEYAKKLVNLNNKPSSIMFLASLYEKTKQYKKAIELYKKMDIEKGIKFSSIGNDYYLLGNIKKAFEYFKKAYEAQNDISYAEKATYMLMRQGKYKDVIEFIKKENVPLSTDRIKYFYGVSLMSEKKYEEAAKIFKKISPSSILFKDALYNEVVCYTKLNEKNKAISVLLSVKNKDKDIYYMLADLYLKYNDYKKAIDTVEKNIDAFKNRGKAYFYIADIYYDKLKNKDKAIEYLKKSLVVEPDNPIVLNYLGYLYIDENINIDKGIELVKKALKKDPDNPYYLDSLGWGYFKKGEYKKAIVYLNKAVANRKSINASDDTVIEIHLASVYIKMGNQQKAERILKEILKHFPNNKKAKKLLDKLK